MSCDFFELANPGVRVLQPYQPGKPVEELQRELGLTDVIKLASNENPLGPSPAVINSLADVIPELARYPDGSAYHLKQKLSSFLDVDTAMLTIGNGSNELLELLARVFLRPGLEVIVSQHSFVVYPLITRALGADLVVIPAKDYGQDLDATAAAITPNTRIIFIANPNNPTGTWVEELDLLRFLDKVPKEVLVVLDEAYCEYVDHPDYPDGIALLARYPNLVVTRTFSKAYGLAALRIGYSVSHPEIADLLNRVRQPFNINAMSLVAAVAALGDQEHVCAAVEANKQGMERLVVACETLGLGYIPSAGNFLAIDMGQDAAPIYEALLKLGVIVRPIGVYEMPNHLRVTVGLPEENTRFINALTTVLGGL
jgi:histidinol-phosphate aminotransferase